MTKARRNRARHRVDDCSTQDILNMLTGSLLDNEHDGEPECLERMLTAKVHVFSDSVLCGALDSVSA